MSTATIATPFPRRNPRLRPSRRRLHVVPATAPAAPATVPPPSGIVATAGRDEAPTAEQPHAGDDAARRALWERAARIVMPDGKGGLECVGANYSAEQLAMAAEEIHRAAMTLGHMLNSIRTENYGALDEEVLRAIDAVACADLYLSSSFDALRLAAGLEGYDVVRVDRINRPHLRRDPKGGAR